MFDKFDNIGKIILVKNIVFTNKENIKVADHSALKGRPCIIITETEDKMYLLPCCTSGDKYKKYKMVVKPTDTLDRRWHKESYVSLNSVIEMNIFFNTSYAELTPLAYYKLLKNVINFFNQEANQHSEYYSIYKKIEEDLKIKSLKLQTKIEKM